jgi:hypothetical protein
MPHNWASGEFIRLVRHLVILERGGELHLLEGLPRSWTKPGDALALRDIPTSFGPVSVGLRVDDTGAELVVEPPTRDPPAKLVVHIERFARTVASATSSWEEGGRLRVRLAFAP